MKCVPMTFRAAVAPVLALLLVGCAHRVPSVLEGPAVPASVRVDHGSYETGESSRVITPHYLVYSTIEDDTLLAKIGELMEGALGEYRRIAPELPLTDKPMECHLFASRK